MAKTTYLGANVEVATDSFGGWINKTNQLIYDMGTVVLTAAPFAQPNTTNGGEVTGNSHVEGFFSSSTLVATDAFRGGTISTPGNLNVTSNVVFQDSALIDIQSNTELFNVDANNVVISSNVTLDGPINSSGVLNINSTVDFNGDVNVDGVQVNTSDLTIQGNLTVLGVTTLSSNTTLALEESDITNLDILSTITLNAGAGFDSDVLPSANTTYNLGSSLKRWDNIYASTSDITNLDILSTITLNAGAGFDSNVLPSANTTYNLGSSLKRWDNIYANTFVGNLDWANVTNKPDPVISVALTGDITGSASTTLTNLANGSISIATTYANDIVLGTDTSGNYAGSVIAGSGIDVSGSAGEGTNYTISHTDTSTQASVNNTVGTAIRSISLDNFGHITSITSSNLDGRYPRLGADNTINSYNTFTKTSVLQSTTIGEAAAKIIKPIDDSEDTPALIVASDGEASDVIAEFRANPTGTSVDTADAANSTDSVVQVLGTGLVVLGAQATDSTHAVRADRTITAGSGLTGGGDLTSNRTINHADTSSQGSVNNSGGTVIQDVTLDGYGHVTNLNSVNLDSRFLGISAKAADANLLDGVNSSQFLRSDTNDTMSGRLEMGDVLDMNNNGIQGVDQIMHHGDTDTYMQFHASDQWRVVTGGAERLEVNNSAVTSYRNFRSTGEVTAYYSDARLKDFKGTIENASDKVDSLNGYYYTANKTAQDLGYTDELQVGVSAQEVQSILPEVVTKAPISDMENVDEDYLTVKYEKLVPLLIEAIKEQNKRIKKLESMIG